MFQIEISGKRDKFVQPKTIQLILITLPVFQFEILGIFDKDVQNAKTRHIFNIFSIPL